MSRLRRRGEARIDAINRQQYPALLAQAWRGANRSEQDVIYYVQQCDDVAA